MELGASILWTSVPVEMVIQGLEPPAPAAMEMVVEGRLVQVLPGPDGTGTVQRLFSTDPQDYLNPKWLPGTVINLHQS
ncbi:MAG TPA: YlzJ-like family protein [Symbiobacteriaceae bacterium]|nr:YlzJ-like family protein [Symbiobacteriaceae bacterium]